jgi:hypothetical protein
VISGAGTGMYFGNSDGSAPFAAGVIENNLVVDSTGYNIQVKHQKARPEIPGLLDRQFTVIRHNVLSKALGASDGPMARPNLLVGYFPATGAGSQDLYLVYGNFLYQNPHERLFQAQGSVALYDNVFVNTLGDAVAIQPRSHLPRIIDVFHNTVVSKDVGIYLDKGYVARILGNAVFAQRAVNGHEQEGNFVASFEDAPRFLADPFAMPGDLDVTPKGTLTPGLRDDVSGILEYPDSKADYSGIARQPALPGAFGRQGFRYSLKLEIKR